MERMVRPEQSVKGTGPQVYLRLRPPQQLTTHTSYTIDKDGTELITTSQKHHRVEKHFGFTSILDGSVDQHEVYERCVGPRIDAEEGVTIMMYGTSGSGKTYTLLGDDESVGIIPRALNNIFTNCQNRIQRIPTLKLIRGNITALQDEDLEHELNVREELLDLCFALDDSIPCEGLGGDDPKIDHKRDEETVLIWISFVEIYNELVYDLLAMPSERSKKLKIVYNNGEVFVHELTSVFVKNLDDALRLLRFGRQQATCAATSINDRSSRSHCVFTVDMLKTCKRTGITTRASYKFCDLAGSERVSTTGNTGQRLRETRNINTSLMVLGRCLDAACSKSMGRSKSVIIPHRDSRLTLLIHAALLGKEILVMIATVSPVDKFYEENQNVLNFTSIAQNIVFPEPLLMKQQVCDDNDTSPSEASTIFWDAQGEYLTDLQKEKRRLDLQFERVRHEQVLVFQRLYECQNDFKHGIAYSHMGIRFEVDTLRKQLEDEIDGLMERCKDVMKRIKNARQMKASD